MRTVITAFVVSGVMVAGAALAATRTVEVGAFTSIDAASGLAVEVKQGLDPKVSLRGPKNQIERVNVEVREGGVLRIRPRSNWGFGNSVEDVVVLVEGPAIDGVRAANGALVTLRSQAATPMALRAENGGLIRATGGCSSLEAHVARGGLIEAKEFKCESVNAEAEMGGAAEVHAAQRLEAVASMGGLIEVAGAPSERNTEARMGGAVEFDEG